MTLGSVRNLATAFVLVLASVATFAQGYRIQERNISPEHKDIFRFFEAIQNPVEPRDAFSAKNAPRWDVARLMQFVPSNGISFADVNHAIEGHISAKQIQGALETRNGKAFRAFAHLSHIYSIPYKQYSELTFQNKNDSVVVSVSNWYRLTFDHIGAHPVISKWEYIQLENE